eukprot:2319326-Pleurochrysis_carterae.AAC.1
MSALPASMPINISVCTSGAALVIADNVHQRMGRRHQSPNLAEGKVLSSAREVILLKYWVLRSAAQLRLQYPEKGILEVVNREHKRLDKIGQFEVSNTFLPMRVPYGTKSSLNGPRDLVCICI